MTAQGRCQTASDDFLPREQIGTALWSSMTRLNFAIPATRSPLPLQGGMTKTRTLEEMLCAYHALEEDAACGIWMRTEQCRSSLQPLQAGTQGCCGTAQTAALALPPHTAAQQHRLLLAAMWEEFAAFANRDAGSMRDSTDRSTCLASTHSCTAAEQDSLKIQSRGQGWLSAF